jgi:hypothetical protein
MKHLTILLFTLTFISCTSKSTYIAEGEYRKEYWDARILFENLDDEINREFTHNFHLWEDIKFLVGYYHFNHRTNKKFLLKDPTIAVMDKAAPFFEAKYSNNIINLMPHYKRGYTPKPDLSVKFQTTKWGIYGSRFKYHMNVVFYDNKKRKNILNYKCKYNSKKFQKAKYQDPTGTLITNLNRNAADYCYNSLFLKTLNYYRSN